MWLWPSLLTSAEKRAIGFAITFFMTIFLLLGAQNFNNSFATATLIYSPKNIPITNAGFEKPKLEELTFTYGSVPGWDFYDPNNLVFDDPELVFPAIRTSNIDVFYPDGFIWFSNGIGAPEGENVVDMYLAQPPGSGPAGVSQTLNAVLKLNTKYTLQVEVGNIQGIYFGFDLGAGFPGYSVELLAGDTVLARDYNSVLIKEGEFGTSTVTYIATDSSPNLGKRLTIRLLNMLEGPGRTVVFDDVRLTAQKLRD